MPIQNLNGTYRKHAKPITGVLFSDGLAAHQHGVVTVAGRTYNSPFTSSDKSVFPTGRTVSTQAAIAPTKVESPGAVVPLHDFVKVHPWEKGATFSTNKPARPIVGRVGGPSKYANTPANPNAPKLRAQPRPPRMGSQTPVVKTTNLSFLRSGGTLGGHADPQAGTSSHVSKWAVTKNGVVA